MEEPLNQRVRNAMQRAVDLYGSEAKLAEAVGVSQPAVSKAKLTGKVSDRLAIAVHRATGGRVPGNELRPDLWLLPEHVPLHVNQEAQAAQ